MGGFVIVGGSHAAVQMAASARQAGYQEPVTLVYEDAGVPGQKPPLSKEFLLGGMTAEDLALRPPAFYEQQGIRLLPGMRATAIDPGRRRLSLADGGELAYDWLGLATGARARRLSVPGAEGEGVLTLRSLADGQRLRSALRRSRRVAIIGGGFIGLEVAAAARAAGLQVTVLETQQRLVARAVRTTVSECLLRLHRAAGIDVQLGVQVDTIERAGDRVLGVTCSAGRVEADLVLLGVGAEPNQELAAATGLRTHDGVVVDRFGRTSDDRIVAAGDCTRFTTPFSAEPVRLESVQNAVDQARSAGALVAGRDVAHDSVPWFWSIQHGMRLQIAGLPRPDDLAVVRGDPGSLDFTVLHLREGRVVGGESVNRPAEHMVVRRLVAAGARLDCVLAADDRMKLAVPG